MVSHLVLLLIQRHTNVYFYFLKVFFGCGPFLKSLLNFLQYFFCFMFWFFCGVLTPQFSSVQLLSRVQLFATP